MLRKAAVLATAGAVLLAANLAAAQGMTPAPATPNAGGANIGGNAAGAAGAAGNQQMATAEFTGTVKEWNEQEKVLTMDNGDKFYLRGNEAPTNLTDLKAGNRVKLTFVVDVNQQGEKVLRGIAAADIGAPR